MGFTRTQGFIGFVTFGLLSTLAVYAHYALVLGIDEEEYQTWDLVTEGFTASIALFVVRFVVISRTSEANSHRFLHFCLVFLFPHHLSHPSLLCPPLVSHCAVGRTLPQLLWATVHTALLP
jgi:hypothetical protein